MTLLAQLTDLHVGPGSEWASHRDALALAVTRLNNESVGPDAVVLTGDLVNFGTDEEYDVLMDLLDPLSIPVLALPGNHDARDRVRSRFPNAAWTDQDHASWVASVGHVTLVGLDSVHAGRPGGQMDDQRLAWLADQLHRATGPSVLALHHPPFAVGIKWMDELGFERVEDLWNLLAEHPVDHIICGHFHRPITTVVSGIPASIGIATAPPIHLDLDPDASPATIADPVGYQLHHWPEGASAMVSHMRFLDPQVEPITFELKIPGA